MHSAGVAAIDVAGKGGTAWSAVEAQRATQQGKPYSRTFTDWGIPTEEALVSVRARCRRSQLIASGGIRSGLDIAKSDRPRRRYGGLRPAAACGGFGVVREGGKIHRWDYS